MARKRMPDSECMSRPRACTWGAKTRSGTHSVLSFEKHSQMLTCRIPNIFLSARTFSVMKLAASGAITIAVAVSITGRLPRVNMRSEVSPFMPGSPWNHVIASPSESTRMPESGSRPSNYQRFAPLLASSLIVSEAGQRVSQLTDDRRNKGEMTTHELQSEYRRD